MVIVTCTTSQECSNHAGGPSTLSDSPATRPSVTQVDSFRFSAFENLKYWAGISAVPTDADLLGFLKSKELDLVDIKIFNIVNNTNLPMTFPEEEITKIRIKFDNIGGGTYEPNLDGGYTDS